MPNLSPYVALADYRRRVAEMYARARGTDFAAGAGADPLSPEDRWRRFCAERDILFATHAQSALSTEQRTAFGGLRYFPYNPALRFTLPVDPGVDDAVLEVDLPEDGLVRMRRMGRIHFGVDGRDRALTLFWIQGYGGGIFLPFRDASNGAETYGGGRYLLDTIKHADLGTERDFLVVDFNFAYNPSCAYNPRWHCPLAPVENWLRVPIWAGEKGFTG